MTNAQGGHRQLAGGEIAPGGWAATCFYLKTGETHLEPGPRTGVGFP
jgi:hypothetical protein